MKKALFVLIVLVFTTAVLFFWMRSAVLQPSALIDNISDNVQLNTTGDDNTKKTVNNNIETAKEFIVTGKNFSFAPNVITVKKGDKVKITFKNNAGFHDFKIDEFGVATKQSKSPSEEILEFTANKIGIFEYYCSVGSHRSMGMKGTLKVE